MTRPEPRAPNATGLPARARMLLYGLSARTTNIPGLEYISGRGAARQHQDAGANDTSDVHTRFPARLFAKRQGRQIPICMKAWIWQASNVSCIDDAYDYSGTGITGKL